MGFSSPKVYQVLSIFLMSYTNRHFVSNINKIFQGFVTSYFGSSPKEEISFLPFF